MQLAAFNNNNFVLGHAAMMVNEGLPLYMVSRLETDVPLSAYDGRPARDGVQGRVRRHPFQPELQAEADPAVQGEGRPLPRPYVTVDPDLSPSTR